MKELVLKTFLVAGTLGLLFVASCDNDDDADVINVGPAITLQVNGEDLDGGGDSIDATVGQSIILNLDVTDDDGIDSVVVVKLVNDTIVAQATQVVYPSATGGGVAQDVIVPVVEVDVDNDVQIEITAYDSEGNTNTEVVNVNVSGGEPIDPNDPTMPGDTINVPGDTTSVPGDTTSVPADTTNTGGTSSTGGTGSTDTGTGNDSGTYG